MKKVAETRNETADGVPYIVIGNKSWNGFTEDLGAEMLAQIKAEYEKEPDQDRYTCSRLSSFRCRLFQYHQPDK